MSEEILPDLNLEVGDLVEYAGVIGVVLKVDFDFSYPIFVEFPDAAYDADIDEKKDSCRQLTFSETGKFQPWHKLPSIKLVEKKIKLKKEGV